MEIKKEIYDINEKAYFNYLGGKSVALVGPSASLVGQGKGKEIDSHDIVIRINNSYPLPDSLKSELGSRTDVLYHTCGGLLKLLEQAAMEKKIDSIEMLRRDGIRWLVAKHHPIESPPTRRQRVIDFIKINNDRIKVVPIQVQFLEDLQKTLKNTEPNTGVLSIMHLLGSKLESLDVYGCDFYATGYYPGYILPPRLEWDEDKKKLVRKDGSKRRTPKMPHDDNEQIRFLLGLPDERIKIHADLKKVLRDE